MTLQPAAPFANYLEYLPFFLSLMNELAIAPIAQAKEAFEKKYGLFIPAQDKLVMDNGKERWAYNLEWARSDLTQLGLMQSPARGIWAISEDGRLWLRQHPDTDYALRSMRTMMHERTQALRGGIKVQSNFEFRWHGETYQAEAQSLIDTATQLLQEGNPPEAFRFKDWYATIEGKQVSVKWLFHLLTKAGYDEFVTYQAVAILRKLGIPIANLHQKSDRHAKAVANDGSGPVIGKTGTDFKALQAFLLEKSSLLEQAKINLEKNALEIIFPNLPASHYAFWLRRETVEIGFYLQSLIPRVNHERIETIQPFAPQWSQALGQTVIAERWGKRWARVYLSADRFSVLVPGNYEQMAQSANLFTQAIGLAGKDHTDWDYSKITAEAFATLTIRFIEATHADLEMQISRQRQPKTNHQSVDNNHREDLQAHQLLDQKIAEIRGFLAGRAIRIPKDDELCDWIQLCYLFDLPHEGQQLFSFIQPQSLNHDTNWFYSRAKKYADLCRIKAVRKGG